MSPCCSISPSVVPVYHTSNIAELPTSAIIFIKRSANAKPRPAILQFDGDT